MSLLLLLAGMQSQAQTSTSWTGVSSIVWSNPANWTNGVPDATKDAFIGDAFFTGPNQPRISSASYCKNLTIGSSVASTLTIAQAIYVSGNMNIQSSGAVSHGNNVIYLTGNWNNDGNYTTTATSSRVMLNGLVQTLGGSVVTQFRSLIVGATTTMILGNDISLSGSGSLLSVYGEVNPGPATGYKITSSGSVRVFNGGRLKVFHTAFAYNYTFTGQVILFAGSTVDYASTVVDQTISSSYTYSHLQISGSGVKSLTANLINLSSSVVASGNITVSAGIFDLAGFTANRSTRTVGGVLTIADGGQIRLSGATNFPRGFDRYELADNSTVNYNGSAQSIYGVTYGHLTLSGSGNKTLSQSIDIDGDFTIQAGTFYPGTNTITVSVKGNFLMASGTLYGPNTTYVMNGTGDQTLNLLGSVPRMNINKSTGLVTLGSDLTVTGNLNFDGGNIKTASNYVVIPSGATITGAGQNTGWVFGNLMKNIGLVSDMTFTYDIGTEMYYSPLSVYFDQVTTAQDLSIAVQANDHPEITYSGLDPVKTVNLYWTFDNRGVVFTTADVTMNWNASSMDGAADPNVFKVGTFDGAEWTRPRVSALASSQITASGITVFDDFSVGEKIGAYTWTGSNYTTDWLTPKNWLGGVPDSTSDVTIPNPLEGRRFYPIITAGQVAKVGTLNVVLDGSLVLDGGEIEIYDNATSTGTFDATNGTVEFKGTSAQTINSGLFYANKVKDLVISNDVTLADADTVTGTLTIAAGKTFTTNDNLTLRSDASGTATLTELPVDASGNATAFITGNVNIERYIPAKKAWRLLSSPVRSVTSPTICAAWQEGAYGSSFAPNPTPGYGVHIMGGASVNGFDQSLTNFPSMKVFDAATNNFTALPATPGTLRPITDYSGYMVYIRGDRSINLMQGNAAAITSTTLRVRGEVKTGKQNISVNAQNLTVIGNPFPSRINFATLTRSNVKNSFYIWDPKLGGTYGLGGYVTVSYNSGTGNYDITTAVSPVSQYIPSGEAILVESADGENPGSITIKESDKTLDGSDQLFGRNTTAGSEIRVNLMGPDGQGGYSVMDGVLTTYHQDNLNRVDRNDARKMLSGTENIGIARDGKCLSIERRKSISAPDTTFLQVAQLRRQAYRLAVTARNMNADNWVAVISDQFAGQTAELPVNLDGTTEYDFTVTADPASAAADRFRIIFRRKTVSPVAETQRSVETPAAVVAETLTPAVTVFPNPVTTSDVRIRFDRMPAGAYSLKLFNVNGQLVASRNIRYQGNENMVTLPVGQGFVPGKYELRVDGAATSLHTSVLKQ